MNYINIIKQIFSGTGQSLFIFTTTLVISLPLGLLFSLVKIQKTKNYLFILLKQILNVMVEILRGTPLMLQLFAWYYTPYFVFHIQMSRNWKIYAVVLGFSINYAAYFSEIFRAGIQSVPIGQTEAAFILGYNKFFTFFKIILPQTIKRVLPPITNEVITLVKDTSLAFVIGYIELFTISKQIASKETSVMPLFIAGVFYFIFNFVVSFVMDKIEKKFSYFE